MKYIIDIINVILFSLVLFYPFKDSKALYFVTIIIVIMNIAYKSTANEYVRDIYQEDSVIVINDIDHVYTNNVIVIGTKYSYGTRKLYMPVDVLLTVDVGDVINTKKCGGVR